MNKSQQKNKENPFLEKVMKFLMPHGPISSRAMFGGYGIYYGDVIIGSIFQNTLYLRADDNNRQDYAEYACKPFVYEGLSKAITLPYMSLPDAILHDPALLKEWILKAYEASLRYKARKSKKKPSTKKRA